MKLAIDAKAWHRLWSMRFAIATTFITAAATAWVAMPNDWKPVLTHGEKIAIAAVITFLAGATGVARLIDQPKLRAGGKDADGR